MFVHTILLEVIYHSIKSQMWDEHVWHGVMNLLTESHLSNHEVESLRNVKNIITLIVPQIPDMPKIPPSIVSRLNDIELYKPPIQEPVTQVTPGKDQRENAPIDAFLISIGDISQRVRNGGRALNEVEAMRVRIDFALALKKLERHHEACPWVRIVAEYEKTHGPYNMTQCPTDDSKKKAWLDVNKVITGHTATTTKCASEQGMVRGISCNPAELEPAAHGGLEPQNRQEEESAAGQPVAPTNPQPANPQPSMSSPSTPLAPPQNLQEESAAGQPVASSSNPQPANPQPSMSSPSTPLAPPQNLQEVASSSNPQPPNITANPQPLMSSPSTVREFAAVDVEEEEEVFFTPEPTPSPKSKVWHTRIKPETNKKRKKKRKNKNRKKASINSTN